MRRVGLSTRTGDFVEAFFADRRGSTVSTSDPHLTGHGDSKGEILVSILPSGRLLIWFQMTQVLFNPLASTPSRERKISLVCFLCVSATTKHHNDQCCDLNSPLT